MKENGMNMPVSSPLVLVQHTIEIPDLVFGQDGRVLWVLPPAAFSPPVTL
jgi:hypothetical protein